MRGFRLSLEPRGAQRSPTRIHLSTNILTSAHISSRQLYFSFISPLGLANISDSLAPYSGNTLRPLTAGMGEYTLAIFLCCSQCRGGGGLGKEAQHLQLLTSGPGPLRLTKTAVEGTMRKELPWHQCSMERRSVTTAKHFFLQFIEKETSYRAQGSKWGGMIIPEQNIFLNSCLQHNTTCMLRRKSMAFKEYGITA